MTVDIYAFCQHIDLMQQDEFPCQHRESGGKYCERDEPHDDGKHWFSKHTILHERSGNGYHCLQFAEPVAPVSMRLHREKLQQRLESIQAEISEIDKVLGVP